MVMTTLLIFLLEWISSNTNYSKIKFDTKITQLNDKDFETIACRGKCPVLAFYSEDEGIFIRKLDFNDVCNQSILLHEIIHSFQSQKEVKMSFALKELEAYRIQTTFLLDRSKQLNYSEYLSLRKCRSNQSKKNLFFKSRVK